MRIAPLHVGSLALVAVVASASACASSAPAGSDASHSNVDGAQPLGPDPQGNPTTYPIVLVHGFMASPTSFWGSFYQVPDALRADGHMVYTPSLPPFDSVAVRAASLARQIDAALADSAAAKVNLIAHSMGGLDARELISVLGYGDRVASLTMISTPHRGSAVADVILGLLPGSSDDALNALAEAFGATFSDAASDSHLRAALEALAESNADAFNAAHPDNPNVYYQSFAGVASVLGIPNPADDDACEGMRNTYAGRAYQMESLLTASAGFVAHGGELIPNDGLVEVDSAKWGNFRGCYPASHLSELGQISLDGADAWTGFDHIRFYRNLAFELAAMGY